MSATAPKPTRQAQPVDDVKLPTIPEKRTLLDVVSAGMSVVKAFRTHGHLAARLDPLGREPKGDPALDPAYLGLTEAEMEQVPASVLRVRVPGATLKDVVHEMRRNYCGTIAYEIEHLSSHEQRVWLRGKIESRAFWFESTPEEERKLLIRLLRVEGLEHYLKRRFLGSKQFSIEGLEMQVLMVDEAISIAAGEGIAETAIGMAHRGRLNMLAHVLRHPYASIIAEFDAEITSNITTLAPVGGTGDVKYHYGANLRRTVLTPAGEEREMRISLLPNPSHLEFVDPVVAGRVRALQTTAAAPSTIALDPTTALAVMIHGDAAFSGEGVVAETLNLQALPGYRVGGSLHVIANNQVGFTTDPADSRSTFYSSDLAKGFDCPIIHVNADDLRACRTAIRTAMAFRARFHHDIVIDLVGYRRWGHNEGDEPAYTQPQMYGVIADHPSAATIQARKLVDAGVLAEADVDEMRARIKARLEESNAELKRPLPRREQERRPDPPAAKPTAVDADALRAINDELLVYPTGFTPHPKLASQLERRRTAIGNGQIDWGLAEALAFGSLLQDGTMIRLTGQDTERGTFSHRHAVLHDVERPDRYTPLANLSNATGGVEVRNSPLTEAATVAFEYGYATTKADALVLWEAQYGDFVNVAQVIVDQFIMSGWAKWGTRNRLVLLLPHGYEGNGPEHSSARLERFLQSAAEDNIGIAYPTTPAQYFHLLRLQATQAIRRPLIVMTPKGLLRAKDATSTIEELAEGSFRPVLEDPHVVEYREDISRAVVCTGKLYYDLARYAERDVADETALVRVERLYRFPTEELRATLEAYPNLRSVVWAQEEPMNMGAWRSIRHRLAEATPFGIEFEYAGREWRAATAEGYPPAHAREQERIVRLALGLPPTE